MYSRIFLSSFWLPKSVIVDLKKVLKSSILGLKKDLKKREKHNGDEGKIQSKKVIKRAKNVETDGLRWDRLKVTILTTTFSQNEKVKENFPCSVSNQVPLNLVFSAEQ